LAQKSGSTGRSQICAVFGAFSCFSKFRFCLLTLGHLVWFASFEDREKRKPKGIISLHDVKKIEFKSVDGEKNRGDVIYLDLGEHVYMFGDATNTSQNRGWKDQIEFVMKQIADQPKDPQKRLQRSGTIVESPKGSRKDH
jgi:hypothetical protein